ncbi:hypothetical protein BT93_H1829 [Corymbia citriodora subsp. variegata]|nr:hypothetical protein BT93_H1829 [Corymbia citriodora subsp. variegata]
MAQAVFFNLATDILKLAGSITVLKIQLVRGGRDELDSLKDTIETIQVVLLDAEKLKDVMYDVEDLLDGVATQDLRQKRYAFFSKSNQLAYRLKVANESQELRKRLDQIKKDREFRLEENQSEETMTIARGKKPEISVPNEQIIGRKKHKEKIKQLLFDSSSSDSVSFVSIVGKGGLGKTALARLVYNDGEVEKHFNLKIWVCVSDVFDVNLVIKEILKSVNYHDHENKPLHQLQSLLHETLGKKKYLLVLDDMWNEVRLEWLELGDWLKGGKQGSKILVTTRNHIIAKATNEKSAIYDLEGLTLDDSWDLLREVAFGDRQASIDQRLEEMGRDIVRKCAGVPLAIRTIGRLLYGKKEDKWNRYRVKELPKIPGIDVVDNGIMRVLKLSYNHLLSCLKHCFAYCSLFPKDHAYKKDMMINLWVAQDFIESHNGEDNLEEVANNYLSELLCRSFLDAIGKGDDGEVLYFKMHDLMHDLAQKVAGGECKIVNFEGEDNDRGIRHASFISEISSEEKMVSLLKTSKLRMFLYLKGESSVVNSPKVFSTCRNCRALGLGNTDIPLLPSSFGKLKHLRFLDISMNRSIQSLPDSITDLVNLQTLRLFDCTNLQTFPRDLRKLVNLRYLSINGCDSLSHLPPLSELPSLRTLILDRLGLEFLQQTSDQGQSDTTRPFFPSLERLSLVYCNLKGWWGGRQVVEYLEIDRTKMLEQQLLANLNCPSEVAAGSTFIPFSKLKRLILFGSDVEPSMLETLLRLASNLESMRLGCYNLGSLSRGMQQLSSLKELDIDSCEGLDLSCQEDGHHTQWRFLTKLRVLKISNYLNLVALLEWIQHATTLQSLEISHYRSLKSLPKSIGNLSLLEKLVLSYCPSLERLPSKMRNLICLKELRILRCPHLEERR